MSTNKNTNKVITFIVAAILLLLSIYAYQKIFNKTTYEFVVEAKTCENNNNTYLMILETYAEYDELENHDALALPSSILSDQDTVENGERYMLTYEEKEGELKFNGSNKTNQSQTSGIDVAIYELMGAIGDHIACEIFHSSNYHTRRHILLSSFTGEYIVNEQNQLIPAPEETTEQTYLIRILSDTEDEYIAISPRVLSDYTLAISNNNNNEGFFYTTGDAPLTFLIDGEPETISIITGFTDKHSH